MREYPTIGSPTQKIDIKESRLLVVVQIVLNDANTLALTNLEIHLRILNGGQRSNVHYIE